jgi:integration host factor subunit beta
MTQIQKPFARMSGLRWWDRAIVTTSIIAPASGQKNENRPHTWELRFPTSLTSRELIFLTLIHTLSTLEEIVERVGTTGVCRGNDLVTKKEIVRIISERANLTQLKTKEIVQWTFDAIIETLVREGRIELRNFGVFEVKTRKARRARNPRTNQPVEVEAKNVVTFQPGKEMEEQVKNMAKTYLPKRKTRTKAGRKAAAAEEHPGELVGAGAMGGDMKHE